MSPNETINLICALSLDMNTQLFLWYTGLPGMYLGTTCFCVPSLDVECIDAQAFQRLCELPLSEMEREHVTLGMYSRPEDFTLNSVEQQPDLSHLRWTVDVPDDLSFARLVYSLLYDQKPAFRQRDVLELVTNNPALSRTDSEVARNSGLSK